MKYIKLLMFYVVLFPVCVYSTELLPEDENQIEHLLTFVSTSTCKFMRNGSWHEASDAADHIRKKYNYVLGKGLVNSPEDFIKYSATKSSMSGKRYRVQCGHGPEIDSSEWLLMELSSHRASKK